MAMKTGGKAVIGLIIGVGVFFGGKYIVNRPKDVGKAADVGKVAIPDAPEASLTGTAATKVDLPGKAEALNGGLQIKVLEMAWNAQMALNFANGGARTTKGSLLDKTGIDMTIIRQDDDGKSQQDMAKWIKDYHDGTTKAGLFVIDMGSQMDNYLKTINDLVKPLGAEYQCVVFDAVGKSYGEDQLIGDVKFKRDPQLLKGAVVRGVRLGGDLDIALKFAGDNNVPVNSNEKIYDPNALNLSYGTDFLSVVNDYNSNQKETRKSVHNGKTAGDTTVTFDLVATWTPGDVNAFQGRGGVTIISTKQYGSIMPSMVMTCKKFLSDNSSKVEDMIGAICTASDQVRSFNDIKAYAAGINATIWAEKDPAYWLKYYNGVAQGDQHMGGSMVYNAKDLANEFGLNGSTDVYREVYNVFKDIHSKLYGRELDGMADYNKAVDKQYMAGVLSNHPELLEGKALTIDYANTITEKVASKTVQINFATGSAEISPSSFGLLNTIFSSAVASQGLKVGVYGYTDNTGNPDKNQALSEARAESVKNYLIHKGLDQNQIESKGYGQENPVADNNTVAGKAKNRRVEIALGN